MKDSKKISAVFSRFSGGFRGYGRTVSQLERQKGSRRDTYWFGEKEVVVFRLYPQVFEDGVGPEALHVILSTASAGHRHPSTSSLLIPSSLFAHGGWGSVDRILYLSERPRTSLQVHSELTRSTGCCYCLVANEEVQILCATFRVEVASRASTASQEGGLGSNSRPAGA